jgi:hypothetical protein
MNCNPTVKRFLREEFVDEKGEMLFPYVTTLDSRHDPHIHPNDSRVTQRLCATKTTVDAVRNVLR